MQSLATGKERHLQWYRLGTDGLGISSADQGFQAENELGMSLQCTLAAKKANRTLDHINSTARRLRMQFFSLLVKHYIVSRLLHPTLGPQYRTDTKKLKEVHWGHQDVQEWEWSSC